MTHDRDLPEGVIDADPPGGFESAAVADAETAERSEHAVDSALLSESRLPPNTPDGSAPADVSVDSVQSDEPSQGPDPDLSTRDGSEEL